MSVTDQRRPVLAIDGPAASGKGTIAKRLARHYGFAYLDTGVLYRGVAWLLLQAGADPTDREAAQTAAKTLQLAAIKDVDIRTPAVGAAASIVASDPGVRAALLAFQRDFAANPPDGAAGAVLDGRDIGTVICPDATVKLFVTAAVEARARRRWLELRTDHASLTEADFLADIKARDARDAGRDDAPMKRAPDAQLLDTTSLSIDAAFEAARLVVDSALQRRDG